MALALLFFFSCLLGGLGGALGSIVGHAAGPAGLWVGGAIGGLLGSIAAVALARTRHWITDAQFLPTAFGAGIGFVLAAAIAVNTLSTPLGPLLSATLVGVGALVGASRRRATRSRRDHAS